MARIYCKRCAYPLKTCVCKSVKQLKLPLKVVVLQHPKEVSHAKNTIRLAKLVSPEIELLCTQAKSEVNERLGKLSPDKTLLLFPSLTSNAIEEVSQVENQFDTIVILDGSWKQAYAIFHTFSFLQNLQHVHFKDPPIQQYRIRKSKKQSQLSSIEALAYCLALISKTDTSPYLNVLEHMQKNWDGVIGGQSQ